MINNIGLKTRIRTNTLTANDVYLLISIIESINISKFRMDRHKLIMVSKSYSNKQKRKYEKSKFKEETEFKLTKGLTFSGYSI